MSSEICCIFHRGDRSPFSSSLHAECCGSLALVLHPPAPVPTPTLQTIFTLCLHVRMRSAWPLREIQEKVANWKVSCVVELK